MFGAIKTEFGKFGGVLDKVQKQLHTVTRTIEETGTRTRVMERRLRAVEEMDPAESAQIRSLPAVVELQSVDTDADEKNTEDKLPGAA